MTLELLAAGAAIAMVNGANDVSKGVATLVGGGLASERRAIAWGAAWTGVGGVAAALFARAMVATFGTGLLGAGVTPSFDAALATLLGAGAWVLLATRTGLPVSTTHAVVGSLAGVATSAYGVAGVRWSALAGNVALPLLVSPIAALVLTGLVVRALGRAAKKEADCVCVDAAPLVAPPAAVRVAPRLVVAPTAACAKEETYSALVTLDRVHWATSAAISAARAMNDVPKIVALVVAAAAIGGRGVGTWPAFAVVTVATVAGSLTGGRRVVAVLAKKLTRMDRWEGFAANAVSAALVAAGAAMGLPMSTTHVTAGGIVGSSVERVDRTTLRHMLLAWVVTVPASAALGVVLHLVLRAILARR